MDKKEAAAKKLNQANDSGKATSVDDLRTAGLTLREIYQLQELRNSVRYYPHLEFFPNEQWRRLLFMKWRYERGAYVDNGAHLPKALAAGPVDTDS